jgi:hypothetical protein
MNPPLPFALWEVVRRLSEPDEIVKFTLIFDGDLIVPQAVV